MAQRYQNSGGNSKELPKEGGEEQLLRCGGPRPGGAARRGTRACAAPGGCARAPPRGRGVAEGRGRGRRRLRRGGAQLHRADPFARGARGPQPPLRSSVGIAGALAASKLYPQA